jgi:hypothetical protein
VIFVFWKFLGCYSTIVSIESEAKLADMDRGQASQDVSTPWLGARMSEALLLEVTEVTGVTVLPVLQRCLEESVSLSAQRSALEKTERQRKP